MSYVPPPFREKYELCIWKIDSRGYCKIKSSYFSPDLIQKEMRCVRMFEVRMSLDNQTMILFENSTAPSTGLRTVLVFDIYTLDKIQEMKVDLVNQDYLKYENYNKENDLNTPQFGAFCATNEGFPKIACWNEGKYILACVGAQAKSNVIYEFRVYNTETLKIICNFDRTKEYPLLHLMNDVVYNPDNSDSLLFLIKEDNRYSVVEVDFIQNASTEKCRYTVDNLSFIKISEDLSQVFVAKHDSQNLCSKLYCVEYGKDCYLEDEAKPIANLGSFIKYYQIIGNLIIIVYETFEGITQIGMFNFETNLIYEDQFKIDEIHGYTYLEETNEIVCLHKLRPTGVDVTIIDSNAKEISDTTYELVEFSGYRFSFPWITMIKGGSEVIKYDFNCKEFLYCKLPSSLTIIQRGSREEIMYHGLLDLGPYYCKVFLNCDMKNDKMSLESDINFIMKNQLPHDRLINFIADTRASFMNMKEQDAFLLHFVNSIFAYSKDKEVKVESK